MNDVGGRVELIAVRMPSQRCSGGVVDRRALTALNAMSARLVKSRYDLSRMQRYLMGFVLMTPDIQGVEVLDSVLKQSHYRPGQALTVSEG